MSDIFADDLFEICGTQIPVSTIKDYRLGQIEYIMRPVYIEREISKWGGFFKKASDHKIEFHQMEYYAAIIGESKYKNAIEESQPTNVFEAILKTAAVGITDVVSDLTGNKVAKSIKYKTMNAAWRVAQRTLEEIPAVLCRIDGKRSEVFPRDELYPLLGEPIAPTIVMVPALYITATDGRYVFFGNGIQLENIELEYERLKMAVKAVKEIKESKNNSGFLQGIFGKQQPSIGKNSNPFLASGNQPKIDASSQSKEVLLDSPKAKKKQ